MAHHIGKYGDIAIIDLKFVGTWATNKMIGGIPDFTALNVPIFQPWHNPVIQFFIYRYIFFAGISVMFVYHQQMLNHHP